MKPISLAPPRRPVAEPAAAPVAPPSRAAGLATLVAATGIVAVVTLVQGLWTERWGRRDVQTALKRDAAILEKVFPERFGDWEFETELEANPKELERAAAVGHISRRYRNVRTKTQVAAFVVCATPHDASGHTPDRCYPGAGYEIAEQEHRQKVPLGDGRQAEAFVGSFRKPGQTLRIFWTYGGDGTWVAPQIARIELAGRDSVYKLYAIMDETVVKGPQAIQECVNFLATLLPAFDTAVAAARTEASSPGGDAVTAGKPGRG